MAQVPLLQSKTTHSNFRPRDLEDRRVKKEGRRHLTACQVDEQVNELWHKALARLRDTSGKKPLQGSVADSHASTAESCLHQRASEERSAALAASVLADQALTQVRAEPLAQRRSTYEEGSSRIPLSRAESGSYLPSSKSAATARVSFEQSKRINQEICRAESVEQIESICLLHRGRLEAVNISTALHRLAKMSTTSQRKEVSPDLLDQLANRALLLIADFKPQNLSNTAWAFATLGLRSDKLMEVIARQAISAVRDFKPQELTSIAWAFATLGICDNKFMDAIAGQAARSMCRFNPQGLATTAWAFATLKIQSDNLMEAIAREAARDMHSFKPQDLANTAWAFATLGLRSDKLMEAIASQAISVVLSFKPQGLANIAWAFATLKIQSDNLMEAIAREAARDMHSFNPQDLANTAWAFAALGFCNPKFMDAIARQAADAMQGFNPQNLANTAWAFATLGIHSDKLMEAIAKKAARSMRSFKPQNLANIAWAFATLGLRNDRFMESIASEATSAVRSFNPQELTNIAWAFVVLGRENHPFLQQIATVLAESSLAAFSIKELDQLFHANRMVELSQRFSLLPAHWKPIELPHLTHISHLQVDVGKYLSEIARARHLELKKELDIEEIGHCVDFALPQLHLAIEVDGPSHFAQNSRHPLGNALLRNRLIIASGWKLLCIPYWEWDALKTGEEKLRYLNQKIEGTWK